MQFRPCDQAGRGSRGLLSSAMPRSEGPEKNGHCHLISNVFTALDSEVLLNLQLVAGKNALFLEAELKQHVYLLLKKGQ